LKNNIKQMLAQHGKRSYELAEYLKISGTTVSNWCSNSHQPNIFHCLLIARFFKTSVEDVFIINLEQPRDDA